MDPALSGSEPQTVIGKWLDEGIGGGMIRIYRENGKRYIEFNYKDGSSSKDEAVERPSRLGRRFEAKERSDSGDYFAIEKGVNLQLRDREGLIRTANKIG